MRWTDLSGLTGYPTDPTTTGLACGVSINAHDHGGDNDDNSVKIDVVTTAGQVFEIGCAEHSSQHPATITCSAPWVLLIHQPTPGTVNDGTP
ncbi:hypothetical protein O1M54_32875 [Streptomyces diastatochromogenes]|nr:hypothetical protein [Streptomyces diastatochromogenes]